MSGHSPHTRIAPMGPCSGDTSLVCCCSSGAQEACVAWLAAGGGPYPTHPVGTEGNAGQESGRPTTGVPLERGACYAVM